MHGKTDGDRHFPCGGVLRVFEHLTQQAQAVVKTAAVFVRSAVVGRAQEVPEQRGVVGGVDIGDVVARPARAQDRIAVALAEPADIVAVHGLGHERHLRAQRTGAGWPHNRVAGADPA